MRGDALRRGPAREPHPQIDQRQTEVEHRAAARLLAPQPPPQHLPARLERVPAAAHGLQSAQVTAREKPAHRLDVGAEAVVHADHHAFAVPLTGREGPLDAREGQGQRPLAQHMHASRQRRRDMDLM